MVIYTDGSAHPNPGPGGYGVVVVSDDENNLIEYHGKESLNTTNNAEEIKAIVWATIKYGECNPIVYTDSSYALNSLTVWRENWKCNEWLKSDNKPPENLELIKFFDLLWNNGYRIKLKKVQGHSGNKWNELADKIATGKIRRK